MAKPFDLIVVGLGAWGSATLYHAARAGLRVLGLDRFSPPHKVSGHHGNGRIIRMASPEAPDYTPLMARAYALWHALEGECGERLIREVGGLYLGQRGSEIVEGSLASFAGTDQAHELLEIAAAGARFPAVAMLPGEQAVYEPAAGVIRPEVCVAAHLAGARAAGATLGLEEPMTAWAADTEGVTIETARGSHRAARAVLCLGAWTPARLDLPLPLAPERQVVAIYDSRAAGPLPIFVAPAAEAEVVYGLPEVGETYKVALHHGGRLGAPDELLDRPDGRELALLERYVAQRLPALAGKRRDAFTCVYCNAPDRHFIIGAHPDHPRLLYASGDSGHGFKFASVLGECLARLGAGETVPGLGLFDPRRFAPPAG